MAPTLEDVMAEKHITKYRLSKTTGIPWATLSDICSGKTSMERCSAGTIRKLSEGLGMTMEGVMDLETGAFSERTVPEIASDTELDSYPRYLTKAIRDLMDALDRNDIRDLDLYTDEVYGCINSAVIDGEISEDEADRLRAKYCRGKPRNRFQRMRAAPAEELRRRQRKEDLHHLRR